MAIQNINNTNEIGKNIIENSRNLNRELNKIPDEKENEKSMRKTPLTEETKGTTFDTNA